MENNKPEILDSSFIDNQTIRRRKLLPWWIKVFMWIFLLFGALSPFGLILGLLGYQFQFSLYGLETTDPLSIVGLSLTTIFLFKGIVSFGLLTEKGWAIVAGTFDAIVGIAICVYIMVVYPFVDSQPGFKLNFRLELILLIPYLLKLGRIKDKWVEKSVTKN